jgi:hypothetical protein
MPPKPPKTGKSARWTFGDYYLDQPWPERGGSWYACSYDPGTGAVRRRSLRTSDFEQAKTRLIALAAAAPVAGDAPSPKDVLSVRIFESYLDGHGATIRTTGAASRAVELATEWLLSIKQEAAPVSFWTPSQQEAFGKWLAEKKGLAAGTIERTFTVIGSAFNDAAKVKLRDDPFGGKVEGSLIAYAPEITMKRSTIARTLKIAPAKVGGYVPTMEDMAKFIDADKSEHLRRWTILALTTWARPEAISDFEPWRQYNPVTGVLDMNPPGRPQTNKFRPRILAPVALTDWLDEWSNIDPAAWEKKTGTRTESPLPLLMFKRERVAIVKKGIKRLATEIGLPEFTQYSPRRFMATTIRRLCPLVAREKRSHWLGHSVAGSRTTDHYEGFDPEILEDVALGTDFILSELQKMCMTRVLAVEIQLKPEELRQIGAKVLTKDQQNQKENGGRYRDRTYDPTRVNEGSNIVPLKNRAK